MFNFLKRVTQEKTNKSIQELTMFKRSLKINDKVVHNSTQLRGIVIGVDRVGKEETLTVRTLNGKTLKGLHRQEFRLANAENFTVAVAEVHNEAVEFLSGVSGDSFSEDSIINDLV